VKHTSSDPIGYLHDCFRDDRQNTTVWNLFGSNVRARHIFTGTDRLVSGDFVEFASIPPDEAATISALTRTYAQEEDLVYGSFFVVGAFYNLDNRLQPLCSPLFYHPATLEEEDGLWVLRVDQKVRRVNSILLAALCGNNTSYLRLVNELRDRPIRALELGLLQEILIEALPEADLSEMVLFPQLADVASLKPGRRKQPWQKVVPGGAAFLAPKSKATLGTLNELQALSDPDRWSAPIRSLLFGAPAPTRRHRKPAPVPANLTDSQEKVLDVAVNQDLSMTIGPPGTGKSFTIACVALEHMSRGETVLVVSQKDQAVNVVYDKIQELYPADVGVVRAGRSRYLKQLKQRIEGMLHGSGGISDAMIQTTRAEFREQKKIFWKAERIAKKLNKELRDRQEWEIKWGKFLARHWDVKSIRDGLIANLKKEYLASRTYHQERYWSIQQRFLQELEIKRNAATELIRLRNVLLSYDIISKGRADLSAFNQALRARRLSRQLELFTEIDFKNLLRAFPVWLVNSSDLFEVLPFEKELFDVVIIDESSQCDIASCIPALQRAKRALIVGDPKQLRHISFLARAKQEAYANQYGLSHQEADELDYRDKSILDLTDLRILDQDQVCFLDEHHRCLPEIIDFSNQEFYRGALHIMTHRPESALDSPVKIHRIKRAGTLMSQGKNATEAQRIVDMIADIVADHASQKDELCPSIGICTPFRNQVEWIQKKLIEKIAQSQLERFRIIVGTPHRFQGEERDIMFLSFVVDAEAHGNSWRFVDTPEQLNVAVTRARLQQHVMISVAPEDMPSGSLLRKYIEHNLAREEASENFAEAEWMLRDVLDYLYEWGVDTRAGYKTGGITIDVLARNRIERRKKGGAKNDREYSLGIDLIGFPGDTVHGISTEQIRRLMRIGIPVMHLSYAEWVFRKHDACEELDRRLQIAKRSRKDRRRDDDDEDDKKRKKREKKRKEEAKRKEKDRKSKRRKKDDDDNDDDD